MKKSLALIVLAAASLSHAQLYTRVVETGSRFNPATAGTTASTTIVYDDVNVATAQNPLSQPLRITRVTVGMRRAADAPAVSVSAYWTTGSFLGTPTLGTDNLIGSQALALRAGTGFVTELVTFNTNFVVTPNFVDQPGFGQFFIGVNISNNVTSGLGTTGPTGWRITSGAGMSEDRFLMRDFVAGPVTGPWNFGGTTTPGSFYIALEGQPVPEPASMVALGLGIMGIFSRKRRQKSL